MKTFCLLLSVFLFLSRPLFGQTITIGNSTITTNNPDGGNGGFVCAQSATLSQSATIQSLSFYVTSPGGTLTLGVYNAAKQLVASTPTFTPVSGWNTQSVVAPVVLSPGTYWLAYVPSSNSLGFEWTSSGSLIWAPYSSSGIPSSFPTGGGTGSGQWCFYATLNPVSSSPTPIPVASGKPGLQVFGTMCRGDQYPFPYPDPNNIPISQGLASGTQVPCNIIRNDDCNPIHQSYVNDSTWAPGMDATQAYCKAHGMALMFQFFYPAYDGAPSWATVEACAKKIAPYLEGYPVYVIIGNELLNGTTIGNIGSSPFSDLGGAGSTGIDGFIAFVKNLRAILPSTCKLGINEYNVCDQSSGGGCWNLTPAINVYKTAAANGAPLDFLGAEGYWMNYEYSGFASPVAMLNSTVDQFGSSTGVPVIFSEFTPMATEKGTPFYPTQIACWQALLEAMVSNQYVLGCTGPWGGIRYSAIWRDGYGSEALNWMWNDTTSNADEDPNGTGQVGPGMVTSTLTWLQKWVPDNVHP
jgi:hypothetical protein